MSLPFGGRRDQLGLIDDPHRVSLPVIPESFAAAPDGSFWFIDLPNRRLAHFSAAGRYVGEIGGLRFDRYSPLAEDIAFVGPDLYMLQVDHHQGGLTSTVARAVEGDGFSFTVITTPEDHPVSVVYLLQGAPEVVGYVYGFAGRLPLPVGGPIGWHRLGIPGAGLTDRLPGVPTGPRSWMDVSDTESGPHAGQLLRVSFDAPEERSILPILIDVVTGSGPGARSLRAVVTAHPYDALPHGLPLYVQLAPGRPADAERYGGGHWFLEVKDDGSPIVWERLPEPGISSEGQIRHIAMGPGGEIYLMIAEHDHVDIFRRPGS